MKKYLLFLALFIGLQVSNAQDQMWFYGMTSEGTPGGQGSIFKFTPSDATKPVLVKAFEVVAPGNSSDKVALKELPDGQIWGTTGYGGKYNRGVLFSYDPKTNRYTVRHAFNGEDGSTVLSGILLGQDKMIYGGTFRGGKGDSGVVYRFDPATDTYTKLFDLADYQIAGITDRLTWHSNGRIYGCTYVSKNFGSIFSFDPSDPKAFTVEHLFVPGDGQRPVGGLTEYKGTLYGVTRLGGSNRLGVMYSYDPASKKLTVLRHLDKATGSIGVGAMTLYKDKLYGMLSNGGESNFGVLYSYDPNSNTYKKITYFPGPDTSLGVTPLGELHLTQDNKFIGVTNNGSKYRGGALFEFDPETEQIKQIGAFDPANGYHPKGAPVRASDGKIYTITLDGGINSLGAIVVQEDETRDHPPTNLLSLNNSPGGGSPCGTFIQASDGLMYGLARFGGSFGLGVALQLDPKTDKVKVMDEFDWVNGARPLNDFTEYNGRLYCTTSLGGPDDRLGNDPAVGAVSSLDMKTFKLRKEARFEVVSGKAPDGGFPYSKLVLAPNNKLYGTTQRGGKNDLGVIFEFDPASRKIKAVYHFDPNSGYRPIGSMALGEDGWMYGMAQKGGKNRKGTIYKFNYNTKEFGVIASFGGRISGKNVQSALLYNNGILYGTSFEGGRYRMGTIFYYDLKEDKFNLIANMDGNIGAFPYGGMSMGPDGKIYTFISYGGNYNSGTALRIDPKTKDVEKLFEFDRELGAVPYFTAPGLYNPSLGSSNPLENESTARVYPNPASKWIHIAMPDENISGITVINDAGTQVLSQNRPDNTVDVSGLKPGHYTMHIRLKNSSKQVYAAFIKIN